MICKEEFDILSLMERIEGFGSNKELKDYINLPLGKINKILEKIKKLGYIRDDLITKKGLEVLEPFRVKRAVFIAAGLGSRLNPITLKTPKPLIKVKGNRIIDSLLDAVVDIGIEEIYIVRGHLSEKFDQLLDKYPMINFIENTLYNDTNNISSAMCAKNLFKNSYIFESDLLLFNKKLITKYQYSSNYLASHAEETEEWCFISKDGKVKGVEIGGVNCYRMIGVSYWTEDDGVKLAKHIRKSYDKIGGRKIFWDEVVLDDFLGEYDISIRECLSGDIVEIDSLKDLKKLDPNYDI